MIVAAIFTVMIARMFYVVITGNRGEVKNIYHHKSIEQRGDIFDRNGVLLATDLKTKSLYASSILVKNPKSIAKSLSKIFKDLSYKDALKKLTKKNRHGWVLIRRNLTPNQVEKIRDLKVAGLVFQDDKIRVYPHKSVISHYVGYVDTDRKGLAGIEIEHNKKLASGKNINTAMDIRIQDVLHNGLLKSYKENKAKSAAGIVVNVTNGEVLAMVSLPNFDPNLQNQASSRQRFNRVTNGVYELGSVLKIFSNAIAFEDNLVTLEDEYDVSKPIKYGRFTINDDHHVKDILNVGEIFAHSSNIGTVRIAEKIGVHRQKDFLQSLGLLSRVKADFPGLGKPIYPKRWRDINLYTISYGHGIAITPLHLAMGVSGVVNDGIYNHPKFILKSENKHKSYRVLSIPTSELIRDMMKDVVENGTGGKANIKGYPIGGKTGTAEKSEGGRYNEKKTLSSFVAAFPIDKPKYLIYVMFDQTDAEFNTGGMIAAPAAGEIIKNIIPILKLY